jgi:hypothetical protein
MRGTDPLRTLPTSTRRISTLSPPAIQWRSAAMDKVRVKTGVEIISSAAVIVMAVLLCVSLLFHYFSRPSGVALRHGLQNGQQIAALTGIDYRTSSKTVVIALSTKCSCPESLELYKQVSSVYRQAGSDIQLVAVFPESQTDVETFMADAKLDFKGIANVNLDKLSIPGTPSIVLIDREGKVIDFWLGRVSGNSEKEAIIAALS